MQQVVSTNIQCISVNGVVTYQTMAISIIVHQLMFIYAAYLYCTVVKYAVMIE